MSKQIYQFKPLSCIKADAQAVGEVCARLDEEGRLTPENLLEESRDEDAPLHDHIEWDDTVAAEKYRVSQCAHVIRCIVTVVKHEKSEVVTKAFVSVHEPGGKKDVYRGVSVALQDVTTRETILRNAKRELMTFKSKYIQLRELAGVFDAIDQLTIDDIDES